MTNKHFLHRQLHWRWGQQAPVSNTVTVVLTVVFLTSPINGNTEKYAAIMWISQTPSSIIRIPLSRNMVASSSTLILLCYRMSDMTGKIQSFGPTTQNTANCTQSVITVG
jgi:hypothetical protein